MYTARLPVMADAEADETNLIDQLANVELGDESVVDDGGQKSTMRLPGTRTTRRLPPSAERRRN